MEQQISQAPAPPSTSTPQPTDQPPPPPPPPQPQPQPQPSQQPPPPSTITSSLLPPPPNPNPNPTPKPQPSPQSQSQTQSSSIQPSQLRPPFNRPWQPPSSSPFFPTHSPSPPPVPPFSYSSSSSSSSTSVPPAQRGGMAIGVPAHHTGTPPPPSSFSSLNPPSYGQQFGGLGRSSVSGPESVPSPITSQMRPSMQGMQGMGMMGSLGPSSSLRPSGVPAHLQQRPAQSSLRPQSTQTNQSPAAQNFQGHGLLRGPSVGSPGSPSPSTLQSLQPHNQPWLSSGPQGKPPLPPPSFRPPMNPPSLQQRSHIAQQHTMSTPAQQQQTSSSPQPQQSSLSHQQSQEHYTLPPSRVPSSLPHQQQITRGQGLGNHKPSSQAFGQPSTAQPAPFNRTAASAEAGESCNRIVSKRTIQELVTQIDPSERLDPEVEDILVDIADEFVESITTFGCSLAKHRKSNTLEAKDILLHLERNWNITLPGFSGDEIKSYKKPVSISVRHFFHMKCLSSHSWFTNEIHRERLAAIRKSIGAADTATLKLSAGQAGGSAKGHPAKAPANIIGSPNP